MFNSEFNFAGLTDHLSKYLTMLVEMIYNLVNDWFPWVETVFNK